MERGLAQSADWVAVDWGTSNVRAWGVGAAGDVVFTAESDRGMGKISQGDYPAVLSGLLEPVVPFDLSRLLDASAIGTCLAMAAAFCVMTELLIVDAEKRVGRERIKHWERMPYDFRRRLPARWPARHS